MSGSRSDLMPTASPGDSHFMTLALTLAEGGWGRVHPNPLVGAVVVRDGQVAGSGYHAEFGGPHAESVALRAAGEAARGATLYVSLEPCRHHGKTPPCTDAILAAGIARVVFAVEDPGPETGGGAALLAEAGIQVDRGVGETAARAQNAAFFHAFAHSTPYLALKLALSTDGKLARAAGERTAITGDEANQEVHRLRAGFEAILVGSGTVLTDDPRLTARGDPRPRVPPVRIVVDSRARLPLDGVLLRDPGTAPVWVVTGPDADPDRVRRIEAVGARVVPAAGAPAGIDLDRMLRQLRADGIHSILCEGGARLASSLLDHDLVERQYLFHAPRFLGEGGVTAFRLQDASPPGAWMLRENRRVGPDALLVLDRMRVAAQKG